MNNSNALGFLGIGIMMCLLPFLVPGWFPHVAIDGSSTRALWVEWMGSFQSLLGIAVLTRNWFTEVAASFEAPASSQPFGIDDWLPDDLPENVVAVDFLREPPLPPAGGFAPVVLVWEEDAEPAASSAKFGAPAAVPAAAFGPGPLSDEPAELVTAASDAA